AADVEMLGRTAAHVRMKIGTVPGATDDLPVLRDRGVERRDGSARIERMRGDVEFVHVVGMRGDTRCCGTGAPFLDLVRRRAISSRDRVKPGAHVRLYIEIGGAQAVTAPERFEIELDRLRLREEGAAVEREMRHAGADADDEIAFGEEGARHGLGEAARDADRI